MYFFRSWQIFLTKEVDKRNGRRVVLLGAEQQTGTFGAIMLLMMLIACPFVVCKEGEGLGAFITL